jgi:chromosome segregation ATPase
VSRRAFVFLLFVAFASPLAAAEPEAAAAMERDAKWASRLLDAQVRIDEARQRVVTAKAAVSEARHRRYPRGAALTKIEEERDKAEKELADAEAALPELLERAQAEGVSPTVLLRFEADDAAGDPAPD